MISLLKKEIVSFLGSITGYLIIVVFLLVTGLFLWVLPQTGFNILENGYASLSPFFQLSPWLFIFLIPAITMRLFSEEIRVGTIELLYTMPLTHWQIVLAKFFSALFISVLAIVPTLIYYIIVYKIGEQEGNLDIPATLGSYIGLLFLISAFSAIGMFTSSITENQIASFIMAIFLCFILYIGFESIGLLETFRSTEFYIKKLGMFNHYQSISRGVLDTRDLIYFISVSYLFLYLTKQTIAKKAK